MQRSNNPQSAAIRAYVNSLDLAALSKPLDRTKMMKELHIDNPLLADVVESWIEVPRMRMKFHQQALGKIAVVKKELAKFYRAKANHMAAREAWEKHFKSAQAATEEVKEDDDPDAPQYVFMGHKVSMNDVQNMMQYAMQVQLMKDSARMRFKN